MVQGSGQPKVATKRHKRNIALSVLHCTTSMLRNRLYILQLGGWHEQIIDAIQVASVEEVDFDLAFPALGLKDFDLRAQCSSKLGFGSADVRIDQLGSRSFSRLLLRCLLNK